MNGARVDLMQLRYFQAVARHQHVSRAAAELRIAQPALSRSLARLEAELGVPLFDRHGRRLALNRFGAVFAARAAAALDELEQGRREVRDAAGLAGGVVAIAAETLRTVTVLAAGFLPGHPQVSLRLSQGPAPALAAQLAAGEADLCLSSLPVAGAQSAELLTEEVLLAVPPRHRLAGQDEVAVAALAGEPFVTTRPGYWQRSVADAAFARSGATMTIACEGDEPYTIRGLISAGVGVGLLPALARTETDPPVGWVRLSGARCQRTLRIAWRQNAYLPAAARQFRDFAVSYFRRRAETLCSDIDERTPPHWRAEPSGDAD